MPHGGTTLRMPHSTWTPSRSRSGMIPYYVSLIAKRTDYKASNGWNPTDSLPKRGYGTWLVLRKDTCGYGESLAFNPQQCSMSASFARQTSTYQPIGQHGASNVRATIPITLSLYVLPQMNSHH